MGNRIGKRRPTVDEKYTRPQGLYQHQDIDYKKLKKLILHCKLAPCYPGTEERTLDHEECPICLQYYPSLNRSRCCMKGICTECFLQMKPPPNSTQSTQCPYCKTQNYAVEYRGEKTEEERGIEQVEEQKVIEAQIRLRNQEILDEQERLIRRQGISSLVAVPALEEAKYHNVTSTSISVSSHAYQDHDAGYLSSQSLSTIPVDAEAHVNRNWEDNLDTDLEDIMLMEAVWLSIQEQDSQSDPTADNNALSLTLGGSRASEDCHDHHSDGRCLVVSETDGQAVPGTNGEWSHDYSSVVAEAGSSYTGSDIATDMARCVNIPGGVSVAASYLLPETFEEQMMLAMSISLAEARARAVVPREVAWMLSCTKYRLGEENPTCGDPTE
ncbi:hypothetical protein HPP92_009446 [Vanilla planifolia]|uniref:RING-type domain-containing protein n=1 Tax=Vanilla planifolia TaxID=51239 RepID=A0A835RDW5_VANPL|nr:hypothetical protein HPP92_009446 [Vanilla planifolia]